MNAEMPIAATESLTGKRKPLGRCVDTIDLFSGIGGFSLGLERAGWRTTQFVEQDAWCRRVLAKHWPDIPCHDNVETFDASGFRGFVGLVCGGFPCQPVSVAGLRRGQEDDRWLWPHMCRVIDECRPTWALCENTPGLLSLGIDEVLADLESLGYACQTFVVPAAGVDAPHRRDRVWIIAHAGDAGGPVEFTPAGHQEPGGSGNQGQPAGGLAADTNPGQRGGEIETLRPGRHAANGRGEPVPDTGRRSGEGAGRGIGGEEVAPGREPEPRLGGLDDGFSTWLAEPRDIPRKATNIVDRIPRLKALGNAVVPRLVEVIGRAMMEAHRA